MVYLGKQEPGKPWGKKSRALAEGLLLYEESVNEYGIPIREATDPEKDGWYEVDDSTVDYAAAAIEEYRDATKNPEKGVRLSVVDTSVDESERPQAARRPKPGKAEPSLDDDTGPLKVDAPL